MKNPMQNGFSNPLLRHIQRYARATTIFRAADWDAVNAQALTENLAPQPVRASWQSAPTSLPVGKAIAQAEMSPSSQSPEPSLPTGTPPMPPVESESAAIGTLAVTAPAPLRSLPLVNIGGQAVPEMTAAPSSTAAPTVQRTVTNQGGGSNWNRLQRIMAGHGAKTTHKTPPPAPNVPPASPPAGGLEGIVAAKEIDSGSTTEPPIQRAIAVAESASPPPLESVWPVQQKSPVPPQTPTIDLTTDASHHSAQTITPPTLKSSLTAPSNPAEAEAVRAKLNEVSAARRTDSSVELHLPRRPRPANVLQAKESTESANASFWNRMRSGGTQPEKVAVPTEIGPLPADMWETLGELPPIQPTDGDSSAPDAIQRAMAATETPIPMPTQPASVEAKLETAVPPAKSLGQAVSPSPSKPDAIQRAMAAAETSPPMPAQPTSATSEPVTAVSPARSLPLVNTGEQAASSSPSELNTIQRTIAAAETSAAMPTQPTSEPVTAVPPAKSLGQAVSSNPSEPDSIQRAVTAAETSAPMPTQPTSATSEPQTAVSPAKSLPLVNTGEQAASIPTPPTPDTVQRVVAAAETSAAMPTQPTSESVTAVPPARSLGQAVSSNLSEPDSIQRAVTAAETSSPMPTQPTSEPVTAVPPARSLGQAVSSNPSEPDSIQRAVTAAETSLPMPTQPTSATSEPQTAVSPAKNLPLVNTGEQAASIPTPPTPDIVQRAVAAAETSSPMPTQPTSATSEPQTAVSSAKSLGQAVSPSPSAPDAIQRAVAAAETSSPMPTQPASATSEPETAVSPARSLPLVNTREQAFSPSPSTPDTVQRAVAAAETSPPMPAQPTSATSEPETAVSPARSLPLVNTREQAASSSPSAPDAIQRAVAAAETPPPMPAQPASATSEPETAVSPLQKSMPLVNTGGQAVSPTAPLALDNIQRAVAAAEAPTNANAAVLTTPIQPAAIETNSLQNLSDNIWRITPTQSSLTTAVPAVDNLLERAPIKEVLTKGNVKEQRAHPATINDGAADQLQTNSTATMPTLPIVQRTESNMDSISDPAIEMEEITDDDDGNDVDIDQLVHQVYSQIRRRLAVEWERGRGKR